MSPPAPPEAVILVDAANRAIGRAEKLAAHRSGQRHRAFSIFLVDARGRVLLQRRHREKYHSGGLWANSCCGHPRPGERPLPAARRRLGEELGVSGPLHLGFRTRYRAELPGGLRENEIVAVYFGPVPSGPLRPDPREVAALRWLRLDELDREAKRAPEMFAFWLRHYLTHHADELRAGVQRTAVLLRESAAGGR